MTEQEEKTEITPQVRIGFTHGDINGVGYEVIIKTLMDKRIMEFITPVVFGHSKVASYHRKTINARDFNFNLIKRVDAANPRRPNIVNVDEREVKIDLGISTDIAGEMSYLSLKAAVESIEHDEIDAIVTAPINKKNIQSKSFTFPGHTEYLAERHQVKEFLMMMVSNNFRIGVITGHIPLREVSDALNESLIMSKIQIMNDSLYRDFAIQKPKIAILGLNPHASDNGLIGKEEQDTIIPTINKAFEEGILVYGPYPADGFFAAGQHTKFDGILAMYHDQGLIPFKAFSFDTGVNYTAGLPIVRTSPAHGTAYDIAGKNRASENSMRAATYLACDIVRNRKMFDELNANPLDSDGDEGNNNS
jgi:4-hydroxythreonine-4-phosphate dehydrogenase